MNTSIYLNTFQKSEVLEVLETIRQMNIPDIIILDERENKSPLISLKYVTYLHRIDVKDFNGGTLFCNPRCTAQIASTAHFIEALKPSALFHEMMNS